ncbi:MAG: hypothetical protein Q7K57_33345 [Burkholderiaceae bacterium]|nr:hypothetical protein [Burkholderiaceae bacterium]
MSSAQFNALKVFYPAAQCWSEGDREVAYLPGVTIQAAGCPVEVALLLHPHGKDGYDTRLFVDRKVAETKGLNWQAHTVCGETWWACSWQGVNASLPWVQVLANHLRAFL